MVGEYVGGSARTEPFSRSAACGISLYVAAGATAARELCRTLDGVVETEAHGNSLVLEPNASIRDARAVTIVRSDGEEASPLCRVAAGEDVVTPPAFECCGTGSEPAGEPDE
jgi:hypothetical protein